MAEVKFDDVVGVGNGEGFCRFKGVWNYELIGFCWPLVGVEKGRVREKN